MKLFAATASAVVTIAAGVLVMSSGAQAANLVANPGFESGMSSWSCTGNLGSSVTTPVRTGTRALQGAATKPAAQRVPVGLLCAAILPRCCSVHRTIVSGWPFLLQRPAILRHPPGAALPHERSTPSDETPMSGRP